VKRRSSSPAKIVVEYKLSFGDLYWMYETSAVGLIGTCAFTLIGVFLVLAALATPGASTSGSDMGVGVLALALAFVVAPGVLCLPLLARVGHTVRLTFDEDGLDGWAASAIFSTVWPNLTHPRLESRVLVLPFTWPWSNGWVVVPARAFTAEQFEELLALLATKDVFVDGDRRSLMGSILSILADHLPRRGPRVVGHLDKFPSFVERSGERPPDLSERLRGLGSRRFIRRWLVVVGLACFAVAVVTTSPEGARSTGGPVSHLLIPASYAFFTLGLASYAWVSRRFSKPIRMTAATGLALLALISALISLATAIGAR